MKNSNEKSKYRCEVCDLFECTCFCKCGLPHDQCVCDFTPEDFEVPCHKPSVEVKGSAGAPISEKNFIGVKGGDGGLYENFTFHHKEINVIGNNGITLKDVEDLDFTETCDYVASKTESEERQCTCGELSVVDGSIQHCFDGKPCFVVKDYGTTPTPNLTPESTEMEEWELDFRKKYNDMDVDEEVQFISNLLSSHSQKLKEKIVKEIPKKREIGKDCNRCMSCESGMSNCEIRDRDREYNRALEGVINIINNS